MSAAGLTVPRLAPETGALLFDVDGVLTATATVHARAWKEAYDELLGRLGTGLPFDPASVVGVDRTGHADALREHGADMVLRNVDELELDR